MSLVCPVCHDPESIARIHSSHGARAPGFDSVHLDYIVTLHNFGVGHLVLVGGLGVLHSADTQRREEIKPSDPDSPFSGGSFVADCQAISCGSSLAPSVLDGFHAEFICFLSWESV